jgi:membrane-associated phospholipid phosphatase
MTPLDFEIDPPHAFSVDENSALHEEALEVYDMYPLSFENQWIAEFWGDDIFELTCTPAGRWISVTNQAVEQFELNLEQALGLYAKMGIALNDGGVSCWKNKYVYNVARPSDYIREYINPSWQTHLITLHNCLNPPFPAYPSGHATFGAAAAGVLEAEFGSQVSFTDNSHLGRDDFMGMPRTFTSWHDMAIENAYSRLPLGVHYRMDAEAGVELGYVASYRVLDLPWKN